jgi:hypothetical protein
MNQQNSAILINTGKKSMYPNCLIWGLQIIVKTLNFTTFMVGGGEALVRLIAQDQVKSPIQTHGICCKLFLSDNLAGFSVLYVSSTQVCGKRQLPARKDLGDDPQERTRIVKLLWLAAFERLSLTFSVGYLVMQS